MGGIVPRKIKEKVILQWIMGLSREKIARENGIGAGTVSTIIKEARGQKEYYDIDLLRAISIAIKDEGLELGELGFAIRIKKMMEEYY